MGADAFERFTHADGDPRPNCAATLAALIEGPVPDPGEAMVAIARCGYRAVQWPGTTPGLRPRDLDSSARRGIRGQLQRLELACGGIDLWIAPGHFLDAAHIDRAVHAIVHAVRLAAELVPAGTDLAARPAVSILLPTEAERTAAPALASQLSAALAECAAAAERDGIALADHAVKAMAIDRVGVGIDPAALLAAAQDPAAAVLAASSTLVAARLVDLLRSGLRGPIGEPGESRLDVTAYRVALEVVGFRRPLVVDARQWRDPLNGLRTCLERWAGRPVAPVREGTER